MPKKISRRAFLSVSALTAGSALLAACGAASGSTQPTTPAAAPTGAPAAAPAAAAPTAAPVDAATAAPVDAATAAPAAAPTAAGSGALRVMVRRSAAITRLDAIRWGQPDVSQHLFDSLTRYDVDGKLQGRLAESWELVDPTTWRFKLRPGVKFQNGEEWNAEALKYNVEMYSKLDPPWAYASYFQNAWPMSVEVESPTSALIKTPAPQPRTPRIMTRMNMVPPTASQDKAYADKPFGSGPYRLVEWDKTAFRAVAEANPDYWDGAPQIHRLEFTAGPDDSARIAALQAGEVDVISDVPFDRIADLSANFNVLEGKSWGMYYIATNMKSKSPISDVRVRRALRYAIDTPGIRDGLLAGKGELLKGPIPAAIPDSIDVGGFPARDVEMAKKLLAEAGHADGLNLNLMIQPGEFSKDREICEAIIAQLAEAGVTVKYEEVESGVFQERQKSGDWDMYPNAIYNWVGDTPYYVSVFKTNGYVSSVDDILVKSNAAEGAEQSKLIQQAMQMVWDDAYQLWAVGRVSTWAWVKNLEGAAYLPNNWLLFSKGQLAG